MLRVSSVGLSVCFVSVRTFYSHIQVLQIDIMLLKDLDHSGLLQQILVNFLSTSDLRCSLTFLFFKLFDKQLQSFGK